MHVYKQGQGTPKWKASRGSKAKNQGGNWWTKGTACYKSMKCLKAPLAMHHAMLQKVKNNNPHLEQGQLEPKKTT